VKKMAEKVVSKESRVKGIALFDLWRRINIDGTLVQGREWPPKTIIKSWHNVGSVAEKRIARSTSDAIPILAFGENFFLIFGSFTLTKCLCISQLTSWHACNDGELAVGARRNKRVTEVAVAVRCGCVIYGCASIGPLNQNLHLFVIIASACSGQAFVPCILVSDYGTLADRRSRNVRRVGAAAYREAFLLVFR